MMESLPVIQLESIRFKLNQTVDSIRALQYAIHADNQPYMLPWPELLSKYNVILTQTHSLMLSVSQAASTNPATGRRMKNPLPSIAIHPAQPISEGQVDNAFSSLLRMMRLPEVLDSDKRMVAAMGGSNFLDPKTDQQIIAIMDAIRKEHDYRVERANMAVRMLAEKYNWRRRVGDGTINDHEGPPADDTATSVAADADDTMEGDDALGPMFESDEDEENEMEPVGTRFETQPGS